MSEPLYTRDILRLASDIPHLAPLDPADGTADLRSPTCGSRVAVAVRLGPDRRVTAFSQSVTACAFGQASAALMGHYAIGRDRTEVAQALADLTAWLDGTTDVPVDWPGLATLAPARDRAGRHGAILLPFRALLGAIEVAGSTPSAKVENRSS